MNKVHVQARVDADLIEWFEEHFSIATKQSFIENCFKYLQLTVEKGRLPTPEVYVAAAVAQAERDIHTQTQRRLDGDSTASKVE